MWTTRRNSMNIRWKIFVSEESTARRRDWSFPRRSLRSWSSWRPRSRRRNPEARRKALRRVLQSATTDGTEVVTVTARADRLWIKRSIAAGMTVATEMIEMTETTAATGMTETTGRRQAAGTTVENGMTVESAQRVKSVTTDPDSPNPRRAVRNTIRSAAIIVPATDSGTEEEKESRALKAAIRLKESERLDELQRNGYQIIQSPEKFCFGMDAVLLSGFAQVKPGGAVLDLGTGTGIIPILLEAKTPAEHLTGLEIQEESADMARRSVELNGLSGKINIVTGDIREADQIFKSASFDVITSNPPYMIDAHGLQNPQEPKAIARHEVCCTLEDVVRIAAKLLKPGGHFFMVHRPFRLAEIITVMTAYKLEPKRLRLVYPFVDKEPNMLLIEGVRGGRPRMTVEKPLIIFEKPGKYTAEIRDKYGY